MKRLLALLLALVTVLALTACERGYSRRRDRDDDDDDTTGTTDVLSTGEVVGTEGNDDVITPGGSTPVTRPLPDATQPTVTEAPTYMEPTDAIEPTEPDTPGTAVNGKYANTYGEMADTEVFTCQEMSITLPEIFYEDVKEGYTAMFDSQRAAVLVIREGMGVAGVSSDLSVEEYANAVISNNPTFDFEEVNVEGDYAFTEYAANGMSYCCVMHKGGTAYWFVQFICFEEDYDEMIGYFAEWLGTMSFSA